MAEPKSTEGKKTSTPTTGAKTESPPTVQPPPKSVEDQNPPKIPEPPANVIEPNLQAAAKQLPTLGRVVHVSLESSGRWYAGMVTGDGITLGGPNGVTVEVTYFVDGSVHVGNFAEATEKTPGWRWPPRV